MPEDWAVDIFLNPLTLSELHLVPATDNGSLPSQDAVLKYLCMPDADSDSESIISRYYEILQESVQLHVAPNDERILEKLVWPLKNAICCYMLGNYLGTIALCGMVAEMISILKFEISNITIDGRPVDSSLQKEIFGREFERLGQERRVKVLAAFSLIDDEQEAHFDTKRTARRRYLHFLSHDHKTLRSDALAVFRSAISILVDTIGQDVVDGNFVFKPDMMKYLEQKGLARPVKKGELTEREQSCCY
jgi:hypothetical protein